MQSAEEMGKAMALRQIAEALTDIGNTLRSPRQEARTDAGIPPRDGKVRSCDLIQTLGAISPDFVQVWGAVSGSRTR